MIRIYKPKVAVCICGFVRNYEKYFNSFFENIITPNKEQYDFDFFISTWDIRNTRLTRAFENRNINDFSEIPINEIKKMFNPVSIIVEHFDDTLFNEYSKYKGTNEPTSLFSQFYKLRQVGTLLEDYVDASDNMYDFVIRTRFDIHIPKTVKLCLLDSSLFYVDDEKYGMGWTSDKFCICSYHNFCIYSKFFNHLEELINRRGDNIPEYLLNMYLEDNKIKFVKMKDFYIDL